LIFIVHLMMIFFTAIAAAEKLSIKIMRVLRLYSSAINFC
jgi:hypothetical protein